MPSYRTGKYLFDLLYVSIAAQIGVMQFLLNIFHRFSWTFLISNPVVIPLVTVILILSFIQLPFALAGYTFKPLIRFTDFLIRLNINFIETVSQLKFLIFERIYFSDILTIALIISIVLIYFFWKNPQRNKNLIFPAIAIFMIAILIDLYLRNRREAVYITQMHFKPVLTEIHGRRIIFYSNDTIPHSFFADYRYRGGFTRIEQRALPIAFVTQERKYLLLDRNLPDTLFSPPVHALLLSGSPKIHLDKWINRLQPSEIYIFPDNYSYLKKIWKKSARRQGIPVRDFSEENYYFIKNRVK
jgi:competence protein ComEC